jgi:hypothetical protein
MPYKIKLNNFPKSVLDRILEVDHNETTMREFLKVNFYEPGVNHISANAVMDIIKLDIGESYLIHITEIKRIS